MHTRDERPEADDAQGRRWTTDEITDGIAATEQDIAGLGESPVPSYLLGHVNDGDGSREQAVVIGRITHSGEGGIRWTGDLPQGCVGAPVRVGVALPADDHHTIASFDRIHAALRALPPDSTSAPEGAGTGPRTGEQKRRWWQRRGWRRTAPPSHDQSEHGWPTPAGGRVAVLVGWHRTAFALRTGSPLPGLILMNSRRTKERLSQTATGLALSCASVPATATRWSSQLPGLAREPGRARSSRGRRSDQSAPAEEAWRWTKTRACTATACTPKARTSTKCGTCFTAQTRLEKRVQGDGDTELMKLCCVQLFNAGVTDDVLLIWQAKTASMDADGSIDIQLLCGSGLVRTKTFLSGLRLPEAEAALQRLIRCEAAGDFDDFSTEELSAGYAA